LGAITALLGKDDVIVLDKLVHACLVDAARLSGARIRVFAHGDLGQLEDILRWVNRRVAHPAGGSVVVSERPSRTLIVTESVFSMDGDRASLREIVELKDKYGAWLMVDEAHAAGLYGERRRGLAEACGVAAHIEVQMGTLGKALGAAGGYICGSGRLIDLLVNKARSFIFTTAPVPAAAAAAAAGVRLVQSDAGGDRNGLLWKRVAQFSAHPLIQERLVGRGLLSKPDATSETKSCGPAGMAGGVPTHGSAIFPIIIGAEESAMEVSAALRQRGVWVPAVRYPSVPRGQARLRVTLTAPHTPEEIDRLLDALSSAVPAAIKI
jgi:7-keto-8-aminopelargonate synthetase-like enzyme